MENRFIPVAEPVIGEMEMDYVIDALKSTWVSSLGKYIDRFEEEFADYIGVPHAIAVSNGTTGLHLALHALGIGPGDDVLVPDLTFVATAHAVLQTGATPVFIDVEPDTWCINPNIIERALSDRTRAIIPVHLFGHPADMQSIMNIANSHDLLVIEDSAEAHGAELNGKRVGSLSHVGVFSFYGNKIITTGEGGMITTSSHDLAERLRFLKDHGMRAGRRYYHDELAFNYRMTNIQAALGLAQLQQIEAFIQKKREISRWYQESLSNVPGISFHIERSEVRNVFWLSCILLDDEFPINADELAQRLKGLGIDTRPFFMPMSRLPHLAHFPRFGAHGEDCPEAFRLSEQGLNLPSSCNLDKDTVCWIAERIQQAAFSNNTIDL